MSEASNPGLATFDRWIEGDEGGDLGIGETRLRIVHHDGGLRRLL